MINKFNIAKALFDKAEQVSTDNSYLLIPEGVKHESNPNETYVEEKAIYGNDNSIGIEDSSSDIQFGIYQINVNTPQAEKGGKWAGLQIAGVYQAAFNKGLTLSFGGQSLRIKNASVIPMAQSKTHYIHILSIVYSVIN
jgi:hypothetical protein